MEEKEMREIKFRAWDKVDSRMVFFNNSNDNAEYHLAWWQSSKVPYPALYKNSVLQETENYVITQYTGLKDRNGKEIYEGDVVGGNKDMEGNEYFYAVKYLPDDDWVWNFPTGLRNQFEVIGNTYENPELEKQCFAIIT